MRFLLVIAAALFPFLHDTSYPAELKSCDEERIFLTSKDESFEVSLFNIRLNDKGKQRICPILKKAKTLTFEIDASSAHEDVLPVYLFADGVLVQEKLISEQGANIAIRNPEYKYEKQMEDAKSAKKTLAYGAEKAKETQHKPSYGYRFLLILLIAWISLFYLIFRNKLRLHLS